MSLDENSDEKRILASLSPEVMDRLADLIISKLKSEKLNNLLSKQVVTGSNPVSRSTDMKLKLVEHLFASFDITLNGNYLVTIW
ncbi:MAG: hypothetical protein PHQ86_08945 [Dehalococcoidales bacterium]|nr:hypothetical protein [Dehalococcoidales bacterium]